jgi:hypothetical protein
MPDINNLKGGKMCLVHRFRALSPFWQGGHGGAEQLASWQQGSTERQEGARMKFVL